MIARLWGRLLCMLGMHRRWKQDGYDFGLLSPDRNESMRCTCVRDGCSRVHYGTEDRAEVVRLKFEVIDGGGLSNGSLSIADLRVLPPPCSELDSLFDELVVSRKPTSKETV